MASILTTLGVGSGIDTIALVTDLVSATRSGRDTVLTAKATTNTARLSALSTLTSDITGISTAAGQKLAAMDDKDMAQFVRDLVTSINTTRDHIKTSTAIGATADKSGPLITDSGVRDLSRQLSGLAGTQIANSGNFTDLNDLGVSTGRDGKLTIDETKLTAAITDDPASVRALLGVGATTTGIAGVLKDLATKMTGTDGALTGSKNRYDRVSKDLSKAQTKLDEDMTKLTDRLTKTYTAMDRQVAAFKASQAYITQQVAMWTKSN